MLWCFRFARSSFVLPSSSVAGLNLQSDLCLRNFFWKISKADREAGLLQCSATQLQKSVLRAPERQLSTNTTSRSVRTCTSPTKLLPVVYKTVDGETNGGNHRGHYIGIGPSPAKIVDEAHCQCPDGNSSTFIMALFYQSLLRCWVHIRADYE
jgi:hypothetical protein